MDNRPVKPKPFGQRRFQQNRFQPRGGRGGDRDRAAQEGGRMPAAKKGDLQKRQQWQNYGRDQQRVRGRVGDIREKVERRLGFAAWQ